MNNAPKVILAILVAVILISFFLPWVQVESQHVGTVSKILTGKRQATLGGISGFQVPMQANSSQSRLAISVIRIFVPNVKNADKKSFVVYAVPIIGILMFLAAHFLGSNKLTYLIIAIVGISIFSAGLFKILTTDMNKLILNIKIGLGMWAILFAYLGTGVVGVLAFLNKEK